MILLTRLNGPEFALNPDLIERIEQTPDTVVTLIGGTKYVVSESLDELLDRVYEFRGHVIASAQRFDTHPVEQPRLRVIPLPAD
ncbi:MAG: flagellar FlbD family protein [Acidothermaceae bacterium]